MGFQTIMRDMEYCTVFHISTHQGIFAVKKAGKTGYILLERKESEESEWVEFDPPTLTSEDALIDAGIYDILIHGAFAGV